MRRLMLGGVVAALVATAGFLISVSGAIALAQFAGPLPVADQSTAKAGTPGG